MLADFGTTGFRTLLPFRTEGATGILCQAGSRLKSTDTAIGSVMLDHTTVGILTRKCAAPRRALLGTALLLASCSAATPVTPTEVPPEFHTLTTTALPDATRSTPEW